MVYCDTGSEHPDNHRFLHDCEKWFGKEILILKSKKYTDTWDVFEKTRYLVGPSGARCTTELKKSLRHEFQEPDDLQIFGFTSEEKARAKRFKETNFEVKTWFPLVESELTKKACFEEVTKAGFILPAMYRLGYKNANCIGSPKGGAGYWNKIKKDFPDVFERMSAVEQKLNIAILRKNKQKIFLKDLPEGMAL